MSVLVESLVQQQGSEDAKRQVFHQYDEPAAPAPAPAATPAPPAAAPAATPEAPAPVTLPAMTPEGAANIEKERQRFATAGVGEEETSRLLGGPKNRLGA